MAYVITQTCCNDAACVPVCPVDCIHPRPDEPEYAKAEMLYIDPDVCIDCNACLEACPVEAIYRPELLPPRYERYREINAAYYRDGAGSHAKPSSSALGADQREVRRGFPTARPVSSEQGTLRVAIVGSGPAGCYAADHLLRRQGPPIEVEMFDRLPSPFRLVRAGVAPDHPKTKQVTRAFQWTAGRPGFRLHLNVEIGRHLSHDELLAHHHAVIYGIGSPGDRRLGIPGEELAGSHAATEFVAWYNGHPDYREFVFDLSCKRAVVVGNGNVALDVARILLLSADELAATDIADHALAALAESRIEEVVLLGRRGPVQAAYTSPELLALGNLSDADVLVDPAEVELDDHSRDHLRSGAAPFSARLKTQILTEFAARKPAGKRRRIVLRFLTSPVEILGDERVEAVRIVRNKLVANPDGSPSARATDETETISAGLVLRSIGYRGRPLAGVPFDDRRATLANDGGRVIDPATARPLTGVYTAGWIKRGPSGVMGTNKKCAGDTVELLLADFAAGRLCKPTGGGDALARLIAERAPDAVDYAGWRAIDERERRLGETQGRPRVKLARIDEMLHIAQSSGR